MGLTVDLHLVVFGLVSALAVIAGLVHLALRRGSALAWLAATLVCVSAETLALRYASRSMLGVAAVSLLLPAAYLCAAQAIRLAMGMAGTRRGLVAAAAGLTGLSLVLLAAGAPPFPQTLPFQLAGTMVFLDATLALAKRRERGFLGTGLLIVCGLTLAGIALRAPMFPMLFGEPAALPLMATETFERLVVNGLGVLASALALLVVARIVANEIAVQRHRSEHDALTGLLNRRVLDGLVDRPSSSAGTVVVCDIDHFKAINDGFGHHVGDEVLRSFAAILREEGDVALRVGGEEFALLLFGTGPESAARRAEKIRRRFNAFRQPEIGEAIAPSASFGLASFAAGHPIREALRRADAALYAAKRNGRNRLSLAPDEATALEKRNRAA